MPSSVLPSTSSSSKEQQSKVIRAPNLKRGKIEESITDRIKLERVLGVTVTSNAALASGPDGTIAYPAGCTVVLFNPKTERQTHLINAARKTITSVAFSACGRYVATGECGHQPALRVWDLYPESGSGPQTQQVCQSLDHKFGISCIAFLPSGKYVVSIGTQHDMIVNVWDWRNNVRIASNKVSNKVKAVSFAENGSYFVTVGNRHVKFWYLESGKFKRKEAVPLMGRPAILGDLRDNYFCDVACGRGECGDNTYAITKSGFLCQFNNRRLLDKWVELRTTSANCITVGSKYIFVGCAESIIRCFDPATLKFVTTLPRTHYLGVDVSMGVNISHMSSPPPDAKYPDTVAITYNEVTNKVTSIYNDHSIYIWDVCHIERVGKSHSFLYHSACIWGVEVAPPNSPLPPGSFLTCSSDDTIRVWTLDRLNDSRVRGMYRQNVYSNDLLKVVYVDDKLNYIKDLDLVGNNANDKQETSYDGRHGVRCIRVSPDGKNLASGDRSGNISIFDTQSMDELLKIEAHDAEVLCLEYFGSDSDVDFLASASRDRLLHVFDVKNGYDFLQTLDDHSSSITAVRFVTNQNSVQMVSCGADKSLIFRTLGEVNNKPQFNRVHNASGKSTLYDMEVDAGQKHVMTACQDRNVRIYNVNSGKHTKSVKGSCGEDGTLIKVVLDRSGIYLATSCTDKSLSVFDYYSGECMATMCGHSELATGLRFTNDCTRLISASGDGCIFVWRVPHDMAVTMQARLSQQAMRQGKSVDSEVLQTMNAERTTPIKDNYRFSVGKLPQWAQKQLTDEPASPQTPPVLTASSSGGGVLAAGKNVCPPRGKWMVRTSTNTLNFNAISNASVDRKFDSDGSKDSSLEENRKETAHKEISATFTREVGYMTTDTGFESAAHDGDIDSDNDYRHRPLYYPCQVDSASGSEFTVTNIDEDELRKSMRKKELPKVLLQKASSLAPSVPYDSDYEEEMLTPTDRSPSSLMYVSTESLDQLVTREKYLQSAYDNLSGTDSGGHGNHATISSKFLARNSDINAAAINAVKMTRNDPEALKKRELLNKRIADAKKKLDSVGHSLKFSQSTHDLSRVVVDRSSSSVKKQAYSSQSNHHQSRNNRLRRSCSLSDLSIINSPQQALKTKSEVSSGRKSTPASSATSSSQSSRATSRYLKNNSIARSRSTSVLNKADSEDEDKNINRLMRPTISSHNKVNKPLPTRRKLSHSTNNLNAVELDSISTSDDELVAVNKSVTIAPVPPTVTPRRHFNNKNKIKASPRQRHLVDDSEDSDLDTTMISQNGHNGDTSTVELERQAFRDAITELNKVTDKIVTLYSSYLQDVASSSSSNLTSSTVSAGDHRNSFEELELLLSKSGKFMHELILMRWKEANGNLDLNTDAMKKLINDLSANKPLPGNGNESMCQILEEFGEILYEMLQLKKTATT